MHDSEVIKTLHTRLCRDLVCDDREKLTSQTLRRNAIVPEMDIITTLTTLTYLATGKIQLCSSDDLGLLQHFPNLIILLLISYKIR